ncbi:YceI family protein [Mucilaginibacter sp. HMF5004]|uniref:YceI family protein n=1 Tax=Mucilaginibacter rivuli TaxID=2857527 RepID=UPI001C5E7938|nr:YceI family protein [Mucilaginibacter rivuli]MBW4891395.1 YceI family protein [Mucilaginibacter rivuli]
MRYISILLLVWMLVFQTGQDIYVCKNAKISLFSKAPIEDIEAISNKGASVFNATTGELAFNVQIRSFQFPKSLMQDHFNTEYMDSDKFPAAGFKGKIQEKIDVTKDGNTAITVVGDLTVHGVTKARTIPGMVTIKSGIITMTAEFMVKCADHNIHIPTIVFHNIAETIKMNVAATYNPYKK